MSTRRLPRGINPLTGYYYPNLVPMSAIREYATRIARKFRPDKIILFGSHAYGTPNQESDVDILVVMPTRNQFSQAVRIDEAFDRPFPLDLIVYTPKILADRIRWGDCFLREIVTRGKVLYEKTDRRMGREGRRRLPGRKSPARRKASSA